MAARSVTNRLSHADGRTESFSRAHVVGPRGARPRCPGATQIPDHDMSTYAAALAYRGLLTPFPFVIFLIALISVLHVD